MSRAEDIGLWLEAMEKRDAIGEWVAAGARDWPELGRRWPSITPEEKRAKIPFGRLKKHRGRTVEEVLEERAGQTDGREERRKPTRPWAVHPDMRDELAELFAEAATRGSEH